MGGGGGGFEPPPQYATASKGNTKLQHCVSYLQVGLGLFAAGKFLLLHFPKQGSGWM